MVKLTKKPESDKICSFKNYNKNQFNINTFKKNINYFYNLIDKKKYSIKTKKILNILYRNNKNYYEIKKLFQEKYFTLIKPRKLLNNELYFQNSIYLNLYLKIISLIERYN
mmetsp:Transcript_29967/g.41759  ORF Transcript_29967/g.41759 Transcript_29967/m.41759 type:complete len:111 (-) Transcript_29967:1495-1827(-)